MPTTTRRNLLQTGLVLALPPGILAAIAGCTPGETNESQQSPSTAGHVASDNQKSNPSTAGERMNVYYLEIVTPEADSFCEHYERIYGITFSDPDPNLGGARTAEKSGGGTIGIRAPMHAEEKPVVRPYILVDDINAAVEIAEEAGAQIAVPPMEIPGHGTCAVYFQGGIECGLWQSDA